MWYDDIFSSKVKGFGIVKVPDLRGRAERLTLGVFRVAVTYWPRMTV